MSIRGAQKLSVGILPIVGWSGASFIVPAAPVFSQNPDGPECRGDVNADRCAEALLRRSLEAYGVPSIQAHRQAGDQNMLLYVVTKDQPLGSSPDYKTYVYDKSEWDGDDPGCTL